MAEHQYYSEEVLIEKMERGEYGWLDYVNHFSPEWQEEYARYCKEHSLMAGNESAAEFVLWFFIMYRDVPVCAAEFVHYKDEQLEAAMENGDA